MRVMDELRMQMQQQQRSASGVDSILAAADRGSCKACKSLGVGDLKGCSSFA